MDGDAGICAVLGHGQRGDGRRHPVQRPGFRGCTQTGAEGEAGLNVRVWKAAGSRRHPQLFIVLHLRTLLLSAPSAGLEPLLSSREV